MINWFKKLSQELPQQLPQETWTFSLEAKVLVDDGVPEQSAEEHLQNFVNQINTLDPKVNMEIQFSGLKI